MEREEQRVGDGALAKDGEHLGARVEELVPAQQPAVLLLRLEANECLAQVQHRLLALGGQRRQLEWLMVCAVLLGLVALGRPQPRRARDDVAE